MRKALLIAVLIGCFLPVLAQHRLGGRSSTYYFRPARTTFYFRPDFAFGPFYRAYGSIYSSGLSEYWSWPGLPDFGFGAFYGYGRESWYGGRTTYYSRVLDSWTPGVTGATISTYLQSPAGMELVKSNWSDLVFKVNPSRAHIWLDGKLIGRAGDYSTERDRYMVLDGKHDLRIESPGYRPFKTELDIEPNKTIQLDIELIADHSSR